MATTRDAIRDRQVAAPLKQLDVQEGLGEGIEPIRDRQVAAPLKRPRVPLSRSRRILSATVRSRPH